jgi:hypothetical protein
VSRLGAAPGMTLPARLGDGAIETEDIAAAVVSPTADEVEGSALPLMQLIEIGEIISPEAPLSWTGWISWRAAAGRRPRESRVASERESRLWRFTMTTLFGAAWQSELAASRGRVLPAALADDEGGAIARTPPRPAADADIRVWRSQSPDARLAFIAGARGVDDPADDTFSSAGSEGSWRGMADEEVEAVLASSFQPGEETLQQFERRIARARAVLSLRGIVTSAADALQAVQTARLADSYNRQGGLPALQTAMEEALDRDENDGLLDALLLAAQLLGDGARTVFRPRAKAQASTAREADVLGRPPVSPPSPSRPSRTVAGTDLARRFEDAMSEASVGGRSEGIPADLMRDLVRSRTRSTIQIKPDITWPSLTDTDQDIETFFEDLEDICDLANDATGMNDIERLRVLGNCLKQSRKKVFRVKLKEARNNGLLRSDPGKVYEEIRARLMEFRETALERQNRVENEYQNLQKGKLTALQFLPLFESVTSEMDMSGVGLSERQLLLGYLRKVGADYRRDLLKDRRMYPSVSGQAEVMRPVATWMEAHRVLLEVEAISAGTKALVAAVDTGGAPDGGKASKAARKKSGAGSPPAVNAVGDPPGVCFRARDYGTCDRDGCTFSHDAALLTKARKEKAATESGKGGGKGKAKGKGKEKGKPKDDKGSGGGKELCLRFMRGECSKSAKECKYSHAAKKINAVIAAVGTAQDKGFVGSSAAPQPSEPPPGAKAAPSSPVS